MIELPVIMQEVNLRRDLSQSILQYVGVSVCLTDIVIDGSTVMLRRAASDAIKNVIWPKHQSQLELYHFTSAKSAQSIISSSVFRLTCILKNISEAEISTFLRTHRLTGGFEKDENGCPHYVVDARNTFIGCFTLATISGEQEATLWQRFASNGGVRLKFRLTPSQFSDIHFRQMYYENSPVPITILDKLSEIASSYNRKFSFEGQSTMAAFNLPASDYEAEREQRLLIRVWDNYIKINGTDISSYVELPLSEDYFGMKLELVEYHSETSSVCELPYGCLYSPR